MKKILFLLLFTTAFIQAQTLQNPTYGNTTTNTLKIKNSTIVTTTPTLTTTESDGIQAKITPDNLKTILGYDVLQYTNFSDFPLTGQSGKAYVWKSMQQAYYWDGSVYKIITDTSKENTANKQNSLAPDGTGVKFPTIDAVNASNSILKKYRFNHNFIKESKIREPNSNYGYAGTVITVGSGGTYATITAAFNAASSGDILQLANGVYDTALEAGGYLLINNTTKRILIRGNSSDNSLVIIRQSSAATYGVRVRSCNEVTFQNITIEGNQNNSPLLMDMNSVAAPVVVLFNNCVIKNTGTYGVTTVNIANTPVNSCKFEFRNCNIYQGSNVLATCLNQAPVSDANSVTYYLPILVVNCNFYGGIEIDGSTNLSVYDSNFLNNSNNMILSIGTNTSPPTYFASHIDIRGCSFSFGVGFTNHQVLLGRGTRDVYFANNTIIMSPGSVAESLGLVVKSIAINVNDVIIEGNYIEAPRPLYLKGAKKVVVNNNTTISNWDTLAAGYGFEINNPVNIDGEIASTENIVEYNQFTGHYGAIGLSQSGSTTALSSFNSCIFRSNKYNIPAGAKYLNDPVTLWGDKSSITKQDSNSILYYY